MSLAQKYARNGFREIRPEINIYEDSKELEAYRQRLIDDFYRRNHRPRSSFRKFALDVVWALLAAAVLVGIYFVLHAVVNGGL